ncbi:MAG TPA: hypothetical protein VN372_09795 [Methanospirillum sp.]|nr:hypothetical protein [Methanospirillum sp.]
MPVYEIKNINLMSMVKNFPIIFVILGMVIGVFTFFVFPTEIARNLSLEARCLSWLIFVGLYALIMFVGILLISWIYNLVSAKVGGVALILELKEE